jgi:hypothetical protein
MQDGIARIRRVDVRRFPGPPNDAIHGLWLVGGRFSSVGFGRTGKSRGQVGVHGEEGLTVSPLFERADLTTAGDRAGAVAVGPVVRPFLKRAIRRSERTTAVDNL